MVTISNNIGLEKVFMYIQRKQHGLRTWAALRHSEGNQETALQEEGTE